MTVFSMQPVQQPAVLEMPLPVVMGCVDRLLGGPGPADQPMRPMTDLESTVVAGLYDRLVAEVRYALSTLVAIEPQIIGVEYSPQLAQLANASDAIVVARFVLRRGEVEHPLTLAMSFNGLLPYLNATGGAKIVWADIKAEKSVPLPDFLRSALG